MQYLVTFTTPEWWRISDYSITIPILFDWKKNLELSAYNIMIGLLADKFSLWSNYFIQQFKYCSYCESTISYNSCNQVMKKRRGWGLNRAQGANYIIVRKSGKSLFSDFSCHIRYYSKCRGIYEWRRNYRCLYNHPLTEYRVGRMMKTIWHS